MMAQLQRAKQLGFAKASGLKIGVLASTKATDLQSVMDAIHDGRLNAKVVCLVSNKEDAYALQRAKSYGISAYFVNPKDYPDRDAYDKAVIEILEGHDVQLILLIGYMRIVGKGMCEKFRHKIMNIHPSLLPAFAAGMDLNVHEEVLKRGCKVTGCTLHFVTENVDEGPIIIQKVVDVLNNDTPESLKAKVQMAEQEALIEGIQLFKDNRLQVEGSRVRILL